MVVEKIDLRRLFSNVCAEPDQRGYVEQEIVAALAGRFQKPIASEPSEALQAGSEVAERRMRKASSSMRTLADLLDHLVGTQGHSGIVIPLRPLATISAARRHIRSTLKPGHRSAGSDIRRESGTRNI